MCACQCQHPMCKRTVHQTSGQTGKLVSNHKAKVVTSMGDLSTPFKHNQAHMTSLAPLAKRQLATAGHELG